MQASERPSPAPTRTEIDGFPPHVIRLRSGALLCTVGRRHYPLGIRGVLSYDDGASWDVAHEKVLRDDAVGSVGYPFSVQLADGTIITAYEQGKPRQVPTEEGGQPPTAGDVSATPSVPNALGHAGGDQPRNTFIQPLATGRVLTLDPNRGPQAYVAGCRYTEDYVSPLGHER